jgi:chromosomal replication initiation ATPase DnaA
MEKKLTKQLALPLSFRNVKNHSNFILNKVNEVALSLIDEFNDIKKFKKKFNFPVLILYGPPGSGKTHLAYIYKEITDAKFIKKLSNINLDEAKFGKSFIFDDFDKIESLNEKLFIHFFNEIFVNFGSLLITTSKPPNEINFSLSDLESRFNSCISTKIELPDDDFLFSILIKELSEKKIFLNDKHCLYIIKRIKRNYKAISLFAETLDIISLEQKTKITLKQIKDVLNIIEA